MSLGNIGNCYFDASSVGALTNEPEAALVLKVNAHFGCEDYHANVLKIQDLCAGKEIVSICFLQDPEMKIMNRVLPPRNEMVVSVQQCGVTGTLVSSF